MHHLIVKHNLIFVEPLSLGVLLVESALVLLVGRGHWRLGLAGALSGLEGRRGCALA